MPLRHRTLLQPILPTTSLCTLLLGALFLFTCISAAKGQKLATISQTPISRTLGSESGPYHSSIPTGKRLEVIRKNSRFLGWKFARQSHQDTSRWIRRNEQPILLLQSYAGGRPALSDAAVPQASLGNAGFLARPSLPAGYIPTAITSGDFNEDGKLDFAVSNGGDNTIYVFLGNGDGTFKVPEILYTQGQSPDWITSVRLHTGGHLDLAVTNGDSNTVEVFPGNGDGTFQPSTQTSVPQIPTFILAADGGLARPFIFRHHIN